MKERVPYLIIGNSAAATGAIEGIRSVDKLNPILVITREERPCYSRPLISYLLGGKVDESRMNYRPPDFHRKNGVEVVTGVELTSLDFDNRMARLSDGGKIAFEKLLVATGGIPVLPEPLDQPGLEGIFTFTTWDDVDSVRAFISKHGVKRAVVVGGGLIGLKSMEALTALGIRTTIVELADRILSMTFDDTASRMAQRHLAEKGVEVICGNTVRNVERLSGNVSGVELSDGRRISCEMVIIAIGVRPNVDFLPGVSIGIDRGIVVDEYMESSVKGIFAAGDAAQARDLLLEKSRPIPILPVAFRQGVVAGVNMAGGKRKYAGGIAMNAVEILGLPTISIGLTVLDSKGADVIFKLDEGRKKYKKMALRDGKVIGAIFVGDIDKAGIITGLIRGRINVSGFRNLLLTDEFGLISLPADYRKHVVSGMGIEV